MLALVSIVSIFLICTLTTDDRSFPKIFTLSSVYLGKRPALCPFWVLLFLHVLLVTLSIIIETLLNAMLIFGCRRLYKSETELYMAELMKSEWGGNFGNRTWDIAGI